MYEPTKYFLQNIGIGDLTFFCGSVLLQKTKGDTIMIKISESILNNFRNGSEKYQKFCIDYITYILSDYNVIHIPNNEKTSLDWSINYDIYDRIINEEYTIEHFRKKFTSNKNDRYKNSVVIVTKIRDLNFDLYKNISNQFFNLLNKMNSEIILLGEREVLYEGEYFHHGKEKIYSIYSDLKKNLNHTKILDLTEKTYDTNNISLENILKDLNIIYNSKLVVVLGGGGFFCTSIFKENFLSLTDNEIVKYYNQRKNKNIYDDFNKFFEKLIN